MSSGGPAASMIALTRLRWLVFGLSGLFLVLFTVALGLWLYNTRLQLIDRTRDEALQLALAAEQQLVSTLFHVDLSLRALERRIERLGPDLSPGGEEVRTALIDVLDQSLVIRDLTLIDNDGRWVAGVLGPRGQALSPSVTIGRAAEAANAVPRVVLSPPLRLERVDLWSVVAMLRWMEGDIRRGWIVAELPTETFSAMFRPLIGSRSFRISLHLENGITVARTPHDPAVIGRQAAGWQQTRAGVGVLVTSTTLDRGEEALVTVRPIAMRDLALRISLPSAAVLAPWYRTLVGSAIAWVAVVGVVVLLTLWVVLSLGRQRLAIAALAESRAEIANQRELLQATFEHISEGLAIFSPDGRLLSWNDRFLDLMDLPSSLIKPGITAFDVTLFQIERGEYGPVDNPEAAARERVTRALSLDSYQLERPVNNGRTVQIRLQRIPGGNMVGIYIDITNQKSHERELIEARDLAHAASQSKSRFLAHMSHELRTPLNAVLGFAEAIRSRMMGDNIDPRYIDYADHIHRSGSHLLSLINDLLDLSRIESGRLRIRINAIDLGELVHKVEILSAGMLSAGNHALNVSLPPEGTVLFADQRAIEQILVNLISNACKFSPRAAPVSLSVTRLPDGQMEIVVRDQGSGMPPDKVQQALTPFGDVVNDYTRQHSGAGIGLRLVKALMGLHGGAIEIESALDVGTTVRLTFPASPGGHGIEVEG